MQHTIQQEIEGVTAFVAAIWAVFFLECVLPFDLTSFGLTPRTLTGLVGIPAMPFLHANLQHIVSNTLPIFILLILLAGSQTNSWKVVAGVVLLSGVLLWLFGRPANHIGASGLIFGLIAFLIVSGLLERRLVPLVISVVVVFFYGGSLLLGVVPRLGSHISWDGHFFGAVAGGIIAYLWTGNSKPQAGTIKNADE
jgi:membrane associated rhomboid family serine protease